VKSWNLWSIWKHMTLWSMNPSMRTIPENAFGKGKNVTNKQRRSTQKLHEMNLCRQNESNQIEPFDEGSKCHVW
jgi:hypothetical protein